MIIIAGAGPSKTKKYITTHKLRCQRCHNDNFWILERTRYFVTLFFLPVMPYKTVHRFYCPICGNSVLLSKEDFEQKVSREAEPYNG
jgi:ribosomal protein S27AE